MTKANRKYLRTLILGMLAMGGLVCTAMDQFDIPREVMLDLFLATAMGAGLVISAAGLAAAIPAVIAFNHFMQKIRILDSELQNFSADFLNIIERDIIT